MARYMYGNEYVSGEAFTMATGCWNSNYTYIKLGRITIHNDRYSLSKVTKPLSVKKLKKKKE